MKGRHGQRDAANEQDYKGHPTLEKCPEAGRNVFLVRNAS